jgi:hypothetical protein
MESLETAIWEWLETWCAAAFLVAGAVLGVHVVAAGVAASTSAELPGWVAGALVATGLAVGLVGLVGFDPLLAEAAPRLSLAGTLVAGVAGLGTFGTFVAVLVDAGRPAMAVPVGPLYVATLVGTVVAFLLFGAACLRSGVPSRGVGLALFGPPVVLVSMLPAAAGPVEWPAPVVGALLAVAHAAVGVVLRGESAPTDRAEPAREPAAE